MRVARGAVVGFEVEPEQRLGVARTEVEPPVAHVDGEAVEPILHAVAVLAGDPLDHRERIGHPGVDLARLRVPVVRLAQLGERRARLRQLLEHDQRGDDAGVGPEVLAEVVVRGVLAAEHRVGVGHDLLHERVADAALHRLAAELADHLGHGLRADHVVHDRFAGVAAEHRGGEDRGGGGPGDDLALVVDEDDAIGVAVEREPDRGVLGEHRPPEVGEVLELP